MWRSARELTFSPLQWPGAPAPNPTATCLRHCASCVVSPPQVLPSLGQDAEYMWWQHQG